MDKLNKFQSFVVRVCRIKPFNVEQALRDTYRKGKERGYNEGRQEKADCLHCPLYKADQIRLTGSAYEQPDKHTDPKKEAMMDFLQLDDSRELPVVSGQLSAIYRRKFSTGKLKKVSITKIEDDPDAWVL